MQVQASNQNGQLDNSMIMSKVRVIYMTKQHHLVSNQVWQVIINSSTKTSSIKSSGHSKLQCSSLIIVKSVQQDLWTTSPTIVRLDDNHHRSRKERSVDVSKSRTPRPTVPHEDDQFHLCQGQQGSRMDSLENKIHTTCIRSRLVSRDRQVKFYFLYNTREVIQEERLTTFTFIIQQEKMIRSERSSTGVCWNNIIIVQR